MCIHTDTKYWTHIKEGEKETESENVRDRDRIWKSIKRCRRNACNITVSEYKAYKEEQAEHQASSQALRWTMQGQASRAASRSFQHSVTCQASPHTLHKLTAPTNSQIHCMSRAFQMCPVNSVSTISIPEFFILTTSLSFQLEEWDESISHFTQAWGSASPLIINYGHEDEHREVLVVQLPRKPYLKSVRWRWHCWPQTDTIVFGAMHTSCSWLPLWWRSGDHSPRFSPG